MHARCAYGGVDSARSGRSRVHKCALWNRSFAALSSPAELSLAQASASRRRRGAQRIKRPARIARDSRCTVSISTATFSGGVAGTMPWPRLKMWPGAGPAARTTAAASRATAAASARSTMRIEIALQRDALADAAARGGQDRRSSRGRRTARRTSAIASSHCPPPFVNTIAGTCRPSAAGATPPAPIASDRARYE